MVEVGTVFVQNRKFYALAPKKINWKQTKTSTLSQLFEDKREVGNMTPYSIIFLLTEQI